MTGSVINRVMNEDFSVNVVQKEEERKTPTLPPKEIPAPGYNLTMIALIIVIMIVVIAVYFKSGRKK